MEHWSIGIPSDEDSKREQWLESVRFSVSG